MGKFRFHRHGSTDQQEEKPLPLRVPAATATEARSSDHCACGGHCPRCQAAAQAATPANQGAESGSQDSGAALDPASRTTMEAHFGADFSAVRIHDDAQAAHASKRLGASAFTIGNDIAFAPGRFSPQSAGGQRLLAHELAHVVQQSGGTGRPGQSHEADAEAAASAVTQGARAQVSTRSGVGIARDNGDSVDDAFYKEVQNMPQWRLDQMTRDMNQFKSFTAAPQVLPTKPDPAEDSGCHKDPYAKPGSTDGTCNSGRKREDDATRIVRKHMNDPIGNEINVENRKKLDRLNEAFFTWRKNKTYIHRSEFSPIEIEADRLLPLATRWQLAQSKMNIGENNVESSAYLERYFVSEAEYKAEWARRRQEYRDRFKACGHSRPSHFKCRDRINMEYAPQSAAIEDASLRQTYYEMQVGGAAVTESGLLSAAGYTFGREVLDWDVDRSASLAGFVSGVANVTGGAIERNMANRNAGTSQAPRTPLEPPPENVAKAPHEEAVPPPGPITTPPAKHAAPPARTIPAPVTTPLPMTMVKPANPSGSTPTTPTPPTTTPTTPPTSTPTTPPTTAPTTSPTTTAPVIKPKISRKPPGGAKTRAPLKPKTKPTPPPDPAPAADAVPPATTAKPKKPSTKKPATKPTKPVPTTSTPAPPAGQTNVPPAPTSPKALKEKTNQGLSDAIVRLKSEITTQVSELQARSKDLREQQQKTFELRKKLEATKHDDPARPALVDQFNLAQARTEELKGRHDSQKAITDRLYDMRNDAIRALNSNTYSRPSGWPGDIVDRVWAAALVAGKGKVLSPSTTEILPGQDWIMGHKPGYEFWKHQISAAKRRLSREAFIREYYNANNYRPETPPDSSGHQYEAPDHINYWP
jgi:Domain of unknown function (DUF4157)/HNH/ENDO VII superfamily nuclease with conserved GHE residues